MNAKDKIQLIHDLFRRIFEAKTPDDMLSLAYKIRLNSKDENIIEMVEFSPFKNGKGLRGYICQDAVNTSGMNDLLILEQNPGKNSWGAELARNGLECAWVMKKGEYLSFVFRHNGNIRIVRANSANRKALENKVVKILAGGAKEIQARMDAKA